MSSLVRCFLALLFLAAITACGASNPASTALSGPLAVKATSPASGATGVFINSPVTATFNQEIDPTTINTATFTLKGGGVAVGGTVVPSGTAATFFPAANLAATTTYTATITTGARNAAGAPLPAEFTWTFTTGTQTGQFTTPPQVVLPTVPAAGATGVDVTTTITATFNRSMDPTTVTAQTFQVKSSQGAVAGAVTASGATATFKPAAALTPNTLYTATITTGAKDTSGIPLAATVSWSFTTAPVSGTTPPAVIATLPVAGATGVFLDQAISITLSKAMDPATISTATFTLTSGGAPVPGTVTLSGATATFKPSALLQATTPFSATITTGARDLAGNPLTAPFTLSFTTGAGTNISPPTVAVTVPASGATNVPLTGVIISATFSKAMDPATINQFTFTLSSGFPLQGTVTLDATGTVATLTPVAPLLATTLHTATITIGAKDLAGTPLAAPFTWSFTTGAI